MSEPSATSQRPEPPPGFPLFLRLDGVPVVVIGGGEAALPKVAALRRAGAAVTVVADRLEPDLAALAADGAIHHVAATGDDATGGGVLDGARLCIAAVEDETAARRWRDAARSRGVLFNAVDRPDLCDAIMPAVVERGPVQVAISTGGRSPALARAVRARIEAALPAGIGALARWCGRWRAAVAAAVPKPARRRFWDTVLEGPEAAAVLAGDPPAADAALTARLADPVSTRPPTGRVSLVGAGPGDADLLTLRAARLIGGADVVLHDRLVAPAVLALARRDARLIDVGKRCGRHAMSQAAINRLLLAHARQGHAVVRLKGGDPFVFGRGGEELDELRRAGVPVEVVPGITAAIAAAARLGIPLTHRGTARALHLVTGHGADDREIEQDWAALARPGATLAIYMGGRGLARLVDRLTAAGLPPETPAVAIESATRSDERHWRAPLAALPALVAAEAGEGPLLVLVGAVVALADARPAPADATADAA